MAKKLSTAEILAQARAQATGGDAAPKSSDTEAEGAASSEPAAAAPEASAAEAAPELTPAAPKPASVPKSTSDILAAARAQAAGKGGGAAPAAAPKSTADILAAARAQSGGAAAPAAGAKSTKDILAAARAQAGGAAPAADAPAAPKKAAVKAAAAVPAGGENLSVQEMLKAVREGKPTGVVAPEKPATIPVPEKPPLPKKAAEPASNTRREALAVLLLSPFVIAWLMFGGAALAFLLAVARFMMPNVLILPPSKFKVGPPTDYPFGTVSNKWKAQFGVWIVNTVYKGQTQIFALRSVCTHLGCTPNWLEGEQKFKCPCHGSGFYISGINFEGPAPRPLERVRIRLAEDGMLEVDKSVKFQEELGQWADPTSFVNVV